MGDNIFLSDQSAWVELSVTLSRFGRCQEEIIKKFFAGMEEVAAAQRVMVGLEGITNLSADDIQQTIYNIKVLDYDSYELANFCDLVHYEAAETFDVPFANDMGDAVKAAYALDPGHIDDGKGEGNYVSLAALFAPVLTDAELAADFNSRVNTLDTDEISSDIATEIADARYWRSYFNKLRVIRSRQDLILGTQEEWATLDDAERRRRIEEFARFAWLIMNGSSQPPLDFRFYPPSENPGSAGYANWSGHGINICDTSVAYRADVIAGIVVHEIRHAHQIGQRNSSDPSAPEQTVESWNDDYDSISDEKYWRHGMEVDARGMQYLYID